MIPYIRKDFNAAFTDEKYQAYLKDMHAAYPGAIEFRIAETPVFVPKYFTRKMTEACDTIIDFITDSRFMDLTTRAIPAEYYVPFENDHPHFIAFDFAVTQNATGEHEPQLIEMQGFPTIFAYQVMQADITRKHFNIPEGFDCYPGAYNRDAYLKLFKEILLADSDPEHVILLEVLPHHQKTRIDFYCTEDFTGVRTVCLSELLTEGRKVYYMRDGKKTKVERIYNRVIFDDLQQQSQELREKGKALSQDLEVEWVSHPNWFYRISKFTMPFISHPFVPATYFLNEVQQLPSNLSEYVLKPLFSFAGQGVIIDITAEDIEKIPDPENWILQKKVNYAGAIATPEDPAKAEIRLFYFWKDGDKRPVFTNNLARLSKGKMIGVRYNQDKTWVGGSLCFFEK
jgi:hypothetical protein